MSMNVVEKIDNRVRIRNVLISVSDKNGLKTFIPKLINIIPEVNILSTGGTFKKIKEILGSGAEKHLKQVSDHTGQPEIQGGLVKTLDYKIYLGLLTETYNDAHQADLKRTGAVAIDMVMVNLYPFKETIAKPNVTPEQARGNIDIGGPCMIRASAKNFIRVASVVDPSDYPSIIDELEANKGSMSFNFRYQLSQKAFEHSADYDRAIADYLKSASFESVKPCYTMSV